MGANLEPQLRGIPSHQLIDRVGRDRLVEAAGAVVLARAEQRAVFVLAVPAASR
jgi:hypothetical protein